MISRQAEDQGTSAFYGAAVNSFFMIFVQHQVCPWCWTNIMKKLSGGSIKGAGTLVLSLS